MGSANSKKREKTEALRMCKERKRWIKAAMESRYRLAAAHVSYIQSLRNIGVALRRFAEAEVLIESSLSLSLSPSAASAEVEVEKTPSHSSYPSPDPDPDPDSPLESTSTTTTTTRMSFMRSTGGGATAVTLTYNPTTNNNNSHSFLVMNDQDHDEESSLGFALPPPPPPPHDSSWDFFHPSAATPSATPTSSQQHSDNSFRFVGIPSTMDSHSESIRLWRAQLLAEESQTQTQTQTQTRTIDSNPQHPTLQVEVEGDAPPVAVPVHQVDQSEAQQSSLTLGSSVQPKNVGPETEREDPSEFITHRAKDFLSSIKDIEHRFFRASESGKELARLLEANQIRVAYAHANGTSSPSDFFAACPLVCCQGRGAHSSHDPQPQNVPKVIIWKRSTSSHSSSSRNPLATTSKDDADDSGSECVEDFCMFSGSHSSTLDRLYAWERKLYDEVKASEVIRKDYDRKCNQLRHQFAKDLSAHVIDKTRASAKDLHSRIRVALHAVNSISKRIEKMRDDELQPQLTELILGFIKMWKAMLECHHAQYITISLAYHARSSLGKPAAGDARQQIMSQLQYEFECFGLSFADWMNSHTSYVEAINGWLQNCVMQTQERSRGSRRPFSPRRVLAPPIFVLCRDWSAGIKALPCTEVSDAIRNFLSDLHQLMKQQQQTEEKTDKPCSDSNGDLQGKDEEANDGNKSGNLGCIHTSLTKVLDKLTKFSEASLKLYEEIRQKTEAARVAYSNPRPFRY